VLVDHAFIVAGGEITKGARNWLGNKLDATKRSQIMFMDRDDILNLYVVMSRCTLQKLTLESPVMQRLASRVEQPFSVSIEAAGLAVFAHRTRFRDPGSLVRT